MKRRNDLKETLIVKITKEQRSRWDKAKALLGIGSRSQYVRFIVDRHAKKILKDNSQS